MELIYTNFKSKIFAKRGKQNKHGTEKTPILTNEPGLWQHKPPTKLSLDASRWREQPSLPSALGIWRDYEQLVDARAEDVKAK